MKYITFSMFLLAIGFSLAPLSAAEEQPTLAFSTYLGGEGNEFGEAIAVDNEDNIYLTGTTSSTNFPATNPLGIANPHMYVTKFDPSGTSQLYSIFIGSGTPYGIAVDGDGAAYVVGAAYDIPTVNAIQATNRGGQDAFVTKINPAGTAVVYSTYLGGSQSDFILDIAIDANKNVYVVGTTDSTNFPTRNPFQPSNAGGQWDIFVARLNAAGSALVYSTYYGGSGWDTSMGITTDNAGNAYVTGDTGSDDFPTKNAYQPNHANWCISAPNNPCTDIYLTKFSPSGTPIYSTYLGGDGSRETGMDVAVDSLGNAYVGGDTDSSDFPLVNAYQSTPPNPASAFLTKFSPDGSELLYSTYLGGTNAPSSGTDIAIDNLDHVFVIGSTDATDFPTVAPIQAARAGTTSNADLFITQFSADGQTIEFSTYFGGSLWDNVAEYTPRIAVDRRGSVYFTTSTHSTDFPLLNAFQAEPGNVSATHPFNTFDSIVAKIAFPLISSPAQATERNYFTTDTPTLTWKPVTWALSYRVQVSRNDLFTGLLDFEGDALASEDLITTAHLDDGFYYWRVGALKPDGTCCAWSTVDSFTVNVAD